MGSRQSSNAIQHCLDDLVYLAAVDISVYMFWLSQAARAAPPGVQANASAGKNHGRGPSVCPFPPSCLRARCMVLARSSV